MTLLFDTRNLFVRALKKLTRNPILILLFAVPADHFPATFHAALQQILPSPRAISLWSNLPRICDSGDSFAECVQQCIAVGNLDRRGSKFRISPKDARDPGDPPGNSARETIQ